MSERRSIQELAERFESLTSSDQLGVMRWLKEMFEACEREHVLVPGRHQVASRIGRAYSVVPNSVLPTMTPTDAAERTIWVLTLCVNTLIGSDTQLYGITAFAIDAWLNEQSGQPPR